jgi:hypothetical protein
MRAKANAHALRDALRVAFDTTHSECLSSYIWDDRRASAARRGGAGEFRLQRVIRPCRPLRTATVRPSVLRQLHDPS